MDAWIFLFFGIALIERINAFPEEAPKNRLFHDPGLVMMENVDGVNYLKHIYLNEANTWHINYFPNKQPVAIARGEKDKHNFTHMDIDYGNRTFVMSDAKSKSIMALTFDEIGMYVWWPVYQGTSSKVNGIAIDWTTDVVYWTDEVYDTIFAASLIVTNAAAPIIDKNLDNPYGIVVHPQKGLMFWTEANSRRYLRRATLGGRDIKVLLFFVDRIAYALHLDYAEERLYWVFTRYSEVGIESCNIEGKQKKQLKNNNHFIFDIDIYKDQFVSMEKTGSTSSMVMYNKQKTRTTGRINLNGTASGLKIIDSFRQYHSSNRCEYSLCPGVCTRSLSDEDCFCMSDLKSELDPSVAKIYCGSRLEVFTGLLVNKGGGIFSMPTNFAELSVSSPNFQPEPRKLVESSSIIQSIVSDIRLSKIFFYDRKHKVIKSVRMEVNAEPEVVSLAALEVGGLAFDSRGKNLYWTDERKEHIMVSDVNGEFPVVLHNDLSKPKAIAIHPGRSHRYLFWSEKEYYVSIWRSYLDGKNKTIIIKSSDNWSVRYVNAMAVDIAQEKLYFCNDENIYITDFDGKKVQHIYYRARRMFTGITVMHEYIVLSDTHYQSSGLYAFHKPNIDENQPAEVTLVGSSTYSMYDYGNWYGVTYHHRTNQPSGSTSCQMLSAEKKCDQICLEGYRRSIRCMCTLGYEKQGNKCTLSVPYRPYLLVVDQRYQKLLQIQYDPRTYVAIPVRAVKQPFSIAYDPVRKYFNGEEKRIGQVYWSDLETGSISRSNMDGSHQEVIVYDPNSFITCMELDPSSRLLFYISRPRAESQYYGIASSLLVLNIDTRMTRYILDEALGDPTSISVSERHGYVYIIEQTKIWRVTMDGSNLERLPNNVIATAIAVFDDYLYFVNVSRDPNNIYNSVTVQLLRSDISGENVTLLTELPITARVQDLAADENCVYWTNSHTRNIQYISLSGHNNITNTTIDDKLIQPMGLAMYEREPAIYEIPRTVSKCESISCSGICLTLPNEEVICDYNATIADIDMIDTELCKIPEIIHGEVEGNDVNRIVPEGYYASVRCFPMHQLSNRNPIVCSNGSWSHIPNCILEYDICGTIQKGYRIYKEPGHYFVYPEMTRVHVILIGGGGGGYDVMNSNITARGAAGDGGNSSFGEFVVTGGKGGTTTKGGKGGMGHSLGGQGSDHLTTCTTGGTAGQALPPESPDRPGKSLDLFAGAGGYSDACTKDHIESAIGKYPGPGGSDNGFYGGGAGSREGGSGGGGGWASKTYPAMIPRSLVPIDVGAAGLPSYSPPGPGLVVVSWGDFVIDSYVGKYDVLNSCVLD